MNDLILMHAPTIFDFNEKDIEYGPVSDLVPSTPVFEMYPIGYLSIMSNLCPEGYKIKIENIALQMIINKKFNVKKRIEKLDTEIFGIDLHWMPHVHGALNLAKLIKEIRPEVPIVLGGLSATYYHNEIIKNFPYIDYVMLGDTTEPFFNDFIDSIEEHKNIENVPNLVYRDNGMVKINKVISPEKYIDTVKLNYKLLIKNCIRNFEVLPSIPYSIWMKSSTAMTFIQKGCHHNCVLCGGSNFAYKNFYFRNMVTYRPIKNIIDDIISIKESLGVPVYISGDIYQAGEKYRTEFFKSIKDYDIDLPMLFEIFNPVSENFYQSLENNTGMYAMEISPESSDEEVRSYCGRFYSNYALEKNMEFAKKHNAGKMDVFFSIGLTHQKKETVDEDVKFAKKYHEKFNDWIHFFISPISPFIDPGSLAFEQSEKYGYRIFARSLEDHYNLLNNAHSWVDALNYETIWLTKKDICNLSIEAAMKMSQINNIESNEENKGKLSPAIFKKSELMWSDKVVIDNFLNLIVNIYRNFYIKFKNLKS